MLVIGEESEMGSLRFDSPALPSPLLCEAILSPHHFDNLVMADLPTARRLKRRKVDKVHRVVHPRKVVDNGRNDQARLNPHCENYRLGDGVVQNLYELFADGVALRPGVVVGELDHRAGEGEDECVGGIGSYHVRPVNQTDQLARSEAKRSDKKVGQLIIEISMMQQAKGMTSEGNDKRSELPGNDSDTWLGTSSIS